MDFLFTHEEQQHTFALAKEQFFSGQYKVAQKSFELVAESALQYNDTTAHISALIWKNRTLLNQLDFFQLSSSLLIVNEQIATHPNEEETYYHRLHTIICNSYFSVGKPRADFEQLLDELIQTDYKQVTFTVGSNLLLYYIEHHLHQEALHLRDTLQTYFDQHPLENKVSVAVHQIYVFLVDYIHENFEQCQITLTNLKKNDAIIHNPVFMYNVFICEALLRGALGEIAIAKEILNENLQKLSDLSTVHFELKLWINLLQKFDLKDDVIHYQQILIDSFEAFTTREMSMMREKMIEEKSRHYYEAQIFIDQLTGVNNRNFYENLLAKQIQVKNYTIVVLDIDKFKAINDTYGHSVGDDAIRFIAKQLVAHIPKHDISIVRYGGDEFILLIPYRYELAKNQLAHLHQMILSTPFHLKKMNAQIPLSISMGISYTDEVYKTMEALFEEADEAIYEAKKNRGTMVVYTKQKADE